MVYLDKLHQSSKTYGVAIHSYVLMTNHVLLLCTPVSHNSLSLMMHALGRFYVRYIDSTL
jgi:putative transposase